MRCEFRRLMLLVNIKSRAARFASSLFFGLGLVADAVAANADILRALGLLLACLDKIVLGVIRGGDLD